MLEKILTTGKGEKSVSWICVASTFTVVSLTLWFLPELFENNGCSFLVLKPIALILPKLRLQELVSLADEIR